jgi:hypothetical protein
VNAILGGALFLWRRIREAFREQTRRKQKKGDFAGDISILSFNMDSEYRFYEAL